VRDDTPVADLVKRAAAGEADAWNRIVDRYAPLVTSVCRRHRLGDADLEDVGATVWLRLVERLDSLREPAALPGWLATTTRNECLAVLRAQGRLGTTDQQLIADDGPAPEEFLLEQERRAALRDAFADLGEKCRQLLTLLFAEPPLPYTEISGRLGIAVGGIGPTRSRCLGTLRAHPAMSALRGPEMG
jgi:RNA polymerase sigma factor (sigma-70 family)